jgi:amidase
MPDPFLDATAAAGLVAGGRVAPGELVEEAIDRVERLNPDLNAVVATSFERARAEASAASGPFAGVPYLLKDTMPAAGEPWTAGIAAVKDAGYRADRDAHFVRRMRAAGFALLGRSHAAELALASATETLAYGPCRNPWDVTRSCGGSSGGAAAAVAAGLVAVAHGSDAGGSIREPASECGVLGLKPTRGRISSGPATLDSDHLSGLVHEGLLARSVRDLAAVLDLVRGRYPGDPYTVAPPCIPFASALAGAPGRLRIGVLSEDPSGHVAVSADCAAAARKAADALADLGHELGEGFPEAIREPDWLAPIEPCFSVFVAREVERFGALIGRPLGEADLQAHSWAYAQQGQRVSGAEYAAAVDALRNVGEAIERWWAVDGWDLWLTPTMTAPTPALGEFAPTRENPFDTGGMEPGRFTIPANVAGLPAISLPLHQATDGMPVGVQLVAAHGREDLLLGVAAQLERALPWADRHPPVA